MLFQVIFSLLTALHELDHKSLLFRGGCLDRGTVVKRGQIPTLLCLATLPP